MDNDEKIANFVAITGASEAQALQMLEVTGFNLEQAIELHFTAGGDADAGGTGGAPPMPMAPENPAAQAYESDEALARRLQGESNAPAEEEVRAPLPARVERLYGDHYQAPMAPRRVANPVPSNVVDAFRDFRAEQGGAGSSGLASMFEPPRDIIFPGSFEEAKAEAASQGRWLILNLQSTSQFASHQLNRDTWRDPGIHQLVASSFVLFQLYDVSAEGPKMMTFYQVLELPAIIVVDPVTGAPMRQWTGFVKPEKLGDALSPFLDTAFTDPGAARLAASLKRKKSATAAAMVQASAVDEEEEEAVMQRILEESMLASAAAAEASPPAAPAAPTEPPAPAAPSAAEVAAAATARLPEEVEGSGGCRVAVRFPDGVRKQRRFPREAPLRCVHDWCLTQCEEAAGGRAFFLSENTPGAPALSNLDATVEAAKVADSMLMMKWAD